MWPFHLFLVKVGMCAAFKCHKMNVRKGKKCSTAPEESTTIVFFVLLVLFRFTSAVCLIVYRTKQGCKFFLFFIKYKNLFDKTQYCNMCHTNTDKRCKGRQFGRTEVEVHKVTAASLFPEVHWFNFLEQKQRVKTVNEQHYRHNDCDPMVKERDFVEQHLGNCRLFKLILQREIKDLQNYFIIAFS